MNKYLHQLYIVGWNYVSAPKIQRYSRWSLGWVSNLISHFAVGMHGYLSMLMLGLDLIHVDKMGLCLIPHEICIRPCFALVWPYYQFYVMIYNDPYTQRNIFNAIVFNSSGYHKKNKAPSCWVFVRGIHNWPLTKDQWHEKCIQAMSSWWLQPSSLPVFLCREGTIIESIVIARTV